MRRGNDRNGVAGCGDGADASHDDHQEQGSDEEIGGQKKSRARVLYAADVDEREYGQDGEAERECVGLECRER